MLTDAGIRISMDGRGRWMDNVFIERLWRSLKSECVYLHAFETGLALQCRAAEVDQPLQYAAATLVAGWAHARRGIQ